MFEKSGTRNHDCRKRIAVNLSAVDIDLSSEAPAVLDRMFAPETIAGDREAP